jgi:hypothetical protein
LRPLLHGPTREPVLHSGKIFKSPDRRLVNKPPAVLGD